MSSRIKRLPTPPTMRGIVVLLSTLCLISSCSATVNSSTPKASKVNPITYFEIPVSDMDRAIRFYHAVFGFEFERQQIDGNQMALLPFVEGAPGATGALAKGDAYVPSKSGPIVYFETTDIGATLQRANANGGKTLYPITAVGSFGFVAEFEDSEGNRIALHASKK